MVEFTTKKGGGEREGEGEEEREGKEKRKENNYYTITKQLCFEFENFVGSRKTVSFFMFILLHTVEKL